MVRKKDKFWEHVEELKGRFKCKFCKHDFSGGITRVKSHLSGSKVVMLIFVQKYLKMFEKQLI